MSDQKVKLTRRQQEILDFIKVRISQTGAPPTRAEIAMAFGFKSTNAAEDHLQALAKKEVLELVEGTSRGIRLKEKPNNHPAQPSAMAYQEEQLSLPLIGRVAAGSPVLAEAHIDKVYQVEKSLFAQKPDYLLKVKGTSMVDAGIMEDDLLAVKKVENARDGQIIVARIDGEVTVKRFQKNKNEIILHPENPDFSPIRVTAEHDFSIEGLAVGLIRNRISNF